MKILTTLIVFGLLLAERGLTATVTVTSLNDNGPGTLRDAITAAAPNDTINFGVTGTIVLTNGELFINKNLTISGPGPSLLTVQRSTAAGTAEFRIFNVSAGTVAISGLAVNNGRAPHGGGIINEDVLSISNCVVIGNVATNLTGDEGKGGGIKNSRTGTLHVRQSIVSSNTAAGGAFTGSGGGFYNENTMDMSDSTVHGNVASGGTGARGGGFVNGFSAAITNSSIRFNSATGASSASGQTGVGGGLLNLGTLFLKDGTASDNAALGGTGTSGDGGSVRGGGIANGIGSTIELQRCTVSGNTATGGDSLSGTGGSSQGGGISGELGSTMRMTNTTISGNSVKAGAGGTSFDAGGGIFGDASTVTTFYSTITSNKVSNGSATDGGGICASNGSAVEIKNTILAANNATVDLFLDDTSSYDSSGFNLIGTTNGPVAPSGPSDQFNVSGAALNLGPLQNNGGPTHTHALLCSSVAIDAGDNAGAPITDQRGFPRIVNGRSDIGAFEASTSGGGPTLLVLTKACPPDPPAPGELLVFSGTISNAGGIAVTNIIIVNNQPASSTPVTNFNRLDPGQSTNFSGTYTVPADYTNCFILDTLTASAVDTCAGALITTNATATCPIAHILTITCPANVTVQCPADIPPPDTNAVVATSTAGGVKVKHTGDGAMTNGCMIMICRIYAATDACGNTVACMQMIEVQDTTPPTVTCPSLLRVMTDLDECSKSNVTYSITASDNCSTVNVVCSPPSGSTFPVGNTVIQCVATDACGNTNACSFTVRVEDMEPPVVMCPPGILAGIDAGQSSKSNVTYMAMAMDNCPGVSVTCAPPSGSTFPAGTNTVMCTATDTSGNTATCNFKVIVGTNQPPMIQCPPDIVASTDPGQCSKSNVMFVVTSTNSSPGVVVTCTSSSGSTFPKGTNIVTCTATDPAGLTNQCSFLVVVNDTEPPALACPMDIVANADVGQCSKSNATYSVTVTDNCPGVTVTCNPPSGSTFPIGTNTVLCTASDAAGNATHCSFLLIVNDTEPPMILCPPDIVTGTDTGQSSRSNVTYIVTATDNCPGVSVTCIPPPGSTFPRGTNIVTCTATDSAGNTATCTFRVIIRDNEAPVIQCPADIVASTDPGQCSRSNVTYVAMATDNDPGVSVTCAPPAGSTFPKGTNSVICTATDATGLTTQCSFLIIVQDTEPPTIACPADILTNPDPGQCSRSNVIYLITGADNCPGVSVSCAPTNGSTFAVGTNTVTCTATDGSGQTASCSFRVIRGQVIPITVSFNVNADCPTNLLPPLPLQASSMISLVAADNEPFSFYRAALSDVPPGFVVQNGFYQGWCVDYAGGLTTNAVYKPAFLYLSHGPLPPQLQNSNWDRINYILNHKQGESFDIQAAIWHFIGGPVPDTDTRFVPLSPFASSLIADTEANGAGFVPGPGEISAVILDLGTDAQTNIIEVVCPRGLQLCAGTNFTLCATVTGTGPLTFRWTKAGSTIPGATSNCLTLTNVSTADAGEYCLEVTSTCNNPATACVTIGVMNCGPPPAPRLAGLAVMLEQELELKVDGEPGSRYIIEASPDLVNWKRITTAVNTDGTLRFVDPDRGSKCFYRVLMEP